MESRFFIGKVDKEVYSTLVVNHFRLYKVPFLIVLLYSKTSLCEHLSKTAPSVLWTPFGPIKLFLLEMNLSNVNISLF